MTILVPDKEDQYTLYIKRAKNGLYGQMTLQRVVSGMGVKLFDRLPFASGQAGFLDGTKDWVQAKGPTPIGEFWLSTKADKLLMAPVGTPFYVLASEKGSRVLVGPSGAMRTQIGVHLENRFPGTIGCSALLHDTKERERMAYALFSEFDRLHAAGVKFIKTKVFF